MNDEELLEPYQYLEKMGLTREKVVFREKPLKEGSGYAHIQECCKPKPNKERCNECRRDPIKRLLRKLAVIWIFTIIIIPLIAAEDLFDDEAEDPIEEKYDKPIMMTFFSFGLALLFYLFFIVDHDYYYTRFTDLMMGEERNSIILNKKMRVNPAVYLFVLIHEGMHIKYTRTTDEERYIDWKTIQFIEEELGWNLEEMLLMDPEWRPTK